MSKVEIGKRIKQAITEAGITQAELARRCGWNRCTMSQYMSGQLYPSEGRIRTMAGKLGVDAAWLAGYDIDASGQGSGQVKLPVYESFSAMFAGIAERYEAAAEQYGDGSCFYLVMNDDSMEPGISAGELMLCREKGALVSGELCAATIDCGARGILTTVRRYVTDGDMAILVPFNSRYAPHTVPVGLAEKLRIHARVEHSIRRWDADSLPLPKQ